MELRQDVVTAGRSWSVLQVLKSLLLLLLPKKAKQGLRAAKRRNVGRKKVKGKEKTTFLGWMSQMHNCALRKVSFALAKVGL